MEIAQNGLDPDEPNTPAWFTFLGIGLFLAGGIFFLVRSSAEEEAPPVAAIAADAAPSADAVPTPAE